MCVPEFAPGDGADDGHLLVHRQARGVGLNTTLAISKIIKNCTVFCTKTVYTVQYTRVGPLEQSFQHQQNSKPKDYKLIIHFLG